METPGHTAVQGRIGVAENDPDRAPELPQLGDHFRARPDHGLQVFIQAEESGAGAGCGVELLIQQRHELTSDIRVSDYPTALEAFEDWGAMSAWMFLQRFPTPHILEKAAGVGVRHRSAAPGTKELSAHLH